jgi:hypothetical protein
MKRGLILTIPNAGVPPVYLPVILEQVADIDFGYKERVLLIACQIVGGNFFVSKT